jgi:hypothetical protein
MVVRAWLFQISLALVDVRASQAAKHPRRVCIAMTADTVHPAHGAAIVEVEKDESGEN